MLINIQQFMVTNRLTYRMSDLRIRSRKNAKAGSNDDPPSLKSDEM